METPKEKAQTLMRKFHLQIIVPFKYRHNDYENAIECAKIAVDEIINQVITLKGSDNYLRINIFWHKVKQELEKM